MTIASDSFRTVTVKIHDISQQLPYIVVNQADDNGKIIRFVPLDDGQKVTGFTGARLYYPPRSGDEYGDYVTGVESDGAWDFTIPVGVLSAGRVGCNLSFIDGDGETYSRNVVFLVEPAVSGVFDPEDDQQTRLDKIIGTVQDAADTAIDSINSTVDDAMESIGKAEESISESVTEARGHAEAAANSAQQASASASAAQTSERNAANSATQASKSATAAKQSEDNAAESARNAAESERNAASSAGEASGFASTASQAATTATEAASNASASASAAQQSASGASASASAAQQSASNASASASAAKVSETNAASSASAAATSETNAAASATAAQQAVDGFGLEVGETTTGEPGTDAVVEIQKTGTKYTANFTIPRGDVGPAGVNENVPLGTASGVVAQASGAYPALPRKVQVHGRTIENLCPAFNHVNNGVTFSTDANGYISIKGTATADIYEQPPIANLPQNTKVWIYVDSDFKAKGITNIYAQSSGGWSLYAVLNQVRSSTTSSGTSGSLVINITSGATVDAKIRIMLVASETEPDASLFVPSGVNTVKPTELVAAGKNFLSYPAVDNSQFDGALTFKNEANGPVKIHVDMATNYNGYSITTLNIPIPAGTYTMSYGDNVVTGLQMGVMFTGGSKIEIGAWERISKKTSMLTEPKTITQFYFQMKNDEKMGDFTVYPMLELGSAKSDWVACETVETELPSDVSLADGDTLAIDRDGTTRIVHAEGDPTVLENVALPELPAPTFNVYATGGSIRPTVAVDYEQDVNLVLQALEAKIAALEIANETN